MKQFIFFVKESFLKNVRIKIRYKFATISDIIIFAITFLAIVFISNVDILDSHYKTDKGLILIFIGYMFWHLGVLFMDTPHQSLEEDLRMGMIEFKLQSKYPIVVINYIDAFIESLLTLIYLLIIGFVIGMLSNSSFFYVFCSVLFTFTFSIISNIGMYGLGMIFGAGSLYFKKIGAWSNVCQAAILLLSNIGSPTTNVFQQMIPFSNGIILVRNLIIYKVIHVNELVGLIIVNMVWFLLGLILFNGSLYYVKKYGTLNF